MVGSGCGPSTGIQCKLASVANFIELNKSVFDPEQNIINYGTTLTQTRATIISFDVLLFTERRSALFAEWMLFLVWL